MKAKFIVLAICAVLVIGGCGIGATMLRKPNTAAEATKAIDVIDNTTEAFEYATEMVTNENGEEVTDAEGEMVTEIATDAAGNKIIAKKIDNIITSVSKAVTKADDSNKGGLIDKIKSGRTDETTKAAATTKKAATKAPATTKAATTTKKATTTAEAKPKSGINVKKLIGDDANQSFLGYRYSSDGYYYCDDKDNWQKDTGYNEVYDKWAPYAAMYIDQVRIRFQYENKNWMIQLWKGQYGYLLIGAEIGVYTCGLNEYTGGTGDFNHFNVAEKQDWLYMQLDCYYCQGGNGQYKKIFTRPYDKYWWATGFVKGQLTKYTAPRTELKTKNRITFKSPDQANLFVQGLKLGGFRRAAGADQLVDDSYFMSGSDVWVLWSTINQDSFIGYGG